MIRNILAESGCAPQRWLVVAQPETEGAIRELLKDRDLQVLKYTHPRFDTAELCRTVLPRLGAESIRTVYVPLNNEEGKGYGALMRFIRRLTFQELVVFSPFRGMSRTSPAHFRLHVLRTRAAEAMDLLKTVFFLIRLPFALVWLTMADRPLLAYFRRNLDILFSLMKPPNRRTQLNVYYQYCASRKYQREKMTADPPKTVEDVFLSRDDPNPSRACLVENRILEMDSPSYFMYRYSKIFPILKDLLTPGMRVCEFGCGQGPNLFFLKSKYPEARYFGFDFDPEGIELGRFLSRRFGMDIRFDLLNLVHPGARPECDMIYTSCAMEQLKYDTEQVLRYFHSLKPKWVVHIEPVAELYSRTDLGRDFFSRRYIAQRDYQDRLYTVLKSMQSGRLLKLRDARRLGMSGNPLNEISLIVWQPF